MTFSSQTNQPDATAQLAHFVGAGHAEIDTARMYNKGGTETMLGAIFGERADLRDAVRVASKAARSTATTRCSRRERRAPVRGDLGGAGDAPVDVYLHNPDATPIRNARGGGPAAQGGQDQGARAFELPPGRSATSTTSAPRTAT